MRMFKTAWNGFKEASNRLFNHKYSLWFIVVINVLSAVFSFVNGNMSMGTMSLIVAGLFAVLAFMKYMLETVLKEYKEMVDLNTDLVALNKELFTYIDRLENERAK